MLFSHKHIALNPALLFIVSFVGLVAIGTILLSLPFSTVNGIAFIDALFMATSSVCITGLVVVDVYNCFTLWGQAIILLLEQSGALGILTFASYFSFFFKRGASYETQLAMGSISGTEKINDVFKTLKQILIITLSIEFVGCVFIYNSLNAALFSSIFDRIFFSVFHAVSAFCNAGFSTLPKGVMEEGYAYNYPFQLSLVFLFFSGGLGFPIVINILKYIKHVARRIYLHVIYDKKEVYKPWVLTLGSKINLVTTLLLAFFGTVVIFISEYGNTLSSHHGAGKFIAALFASGVARSSGFSAIDYSQLHASSALLIMFLMWVGSSPVSTGGGIKTSTFAIAVLNFLSLAQGKKRIEVFNREIAEVSVHRAFATIILSVFAIGMGVFLISIFDKGLSLRSIVFECTSAYCTVGLSLGITAKLSVAGKLVISLLMFVGRITLLTILIAFFKQVKYTNYAYPSEEIIIN